MPHYNVLSKKVTLAEAVSKGQIVSCSGHLATTGTAGKEPLGVAQYDGVAGEIIAVTVIGLEDVTHTGLTLGQDVKVTAGNVVAATPTDKAFATVVEVSTDKSAEILIK